MDTIINKVVKLDVYFNDNDWIFRKDQENISIDDYSNYLIIVVHYMHVGVLDENIKLNLEFKFNNHKKIYNNYSLYTDIYSLILLNKSTHYKYLSYGEFFKNNGLPETNEQYVLYNIYRISNRHIDQTNYNTTKIPKENYMFENFLIIEKRFIRIKKAVKS